jgi:hypothetical protein
MCVLLYTQDQKHLVFDLTRCTMFASPTTTWDSRDQLPPSVDWHIVTQSPIQKVFGSPYSIVIVCPRGPAGLSDDEYMGPVLTSTFCMYTPVPLDLGQDRGMSLNPCQTLSALDESKSTAILKLNGENLSPRTIIAGWRA